MQASSDHQDTQEWVYAGFWRRFFAVFLDGLIFGMVGFVIGLLVVFFGRAVGLDIRSLADPSTLASALQALVWLLVILSFWRYAGGTPGKLLLGLRLVDATTGENIGWLRGLLRYLGYFVSGFPLALGYLWMCWDEKKQTWHDKFANSIVVRRA